MPVPDSTPLPIYLELRGADVLLRVRVQPRAGHEGIGGVHGERLKVRVGAPPADGRANERLRELLSRWLQLPLRDVAILRGEHAREKDLLLRNAATQPALLRQLAAAALQ